MSMLYHNHVKIKYRKKKPGVLKVVLSGGIGNQFFMLFAALDIASQKNSQVIAHSPRTTKGFQIHGSTLDTFEFEPSFNYEPAPFQLGFRIRIYSFLYKRLRSLAIPIILVSNYYESHVLGYDKSINYVNGNVTIKGYFQTYRHFENYLERNPAFSLRLANPSNVYLQMQERLASKLITVIHVRLGDYFLHQNSVGILSAEYFVNAINTLNLSNTEVLVFSDDIAEAYRMISDVLPLETYWIGKDQLSAEESLELMRMGSQFVISNSSFSYWGALLAKDPIKVIAPSKWFKGEQDPLDLVPPGWVKTESVWRK
jgi:hypothetical protein